MEAYYPILLVAGRFAIATGLLMALYWLVWRKQATYRAKRMYLLTLPIVALLIALVRMEVYKPAPVVITVKQMKQVSLPSLKEETSHRTIETLPMEGVVRPTSELQTEQPQNAWFSQTNVFALAYTFIIILLFVPFTVSLVQLHLLLKNLNIERDEENNIYILTGTAVKAPFSFYRNIYLPQYLTETQRRMILAHERSHILHRHYIDVWVIEIVTRLLWWNPFLWWTRSELRNVHEFEADSDVLAMGENVSAYQAILIEEVLNGDIVITNGFNHSFIRRRFIEMLQTTNQHMSMWRKAGTGTWIALVVALMCCTMGEAETIYRTTVSQPTVSTSPKVSSTIKTTAETQPEESSLLAHLDVMVDDTLVVVPVDSGSQTSDAIGYALPFNQSLKDIIPLLGKEQADALGSLLNALGSLQEISPEQYEAWQKESSDRLPNLDDINGRVKWIKDDLNNHFTDAINNLLFQLTRAQISGLVNTGLIDSLGTEKFSQPVSNLPQTFDAQRKMVGEFIFEWCIYHKDVTSEEYQELKKMISNPELLPSLEEHNKDIRERHEKHVSYLLMQINKMDESIGKQLENYIAQYGIRPEEEYMELSITYKDGREVIYQKEGNRFSTREVHEHSHSIFPFYEKAIKAKENEFVIEGFVDENITDSCYLIYLADEHFKIQDEPADTVPVVNKRFTYVLKTNKMTAGRLRCIFPGGEICEASINLFFVPGETVQLYVHNGHYNLDKSPSYAEKINKAMSVIREETRWESPHLPKIKGKVWKEISEDFDPLLDVREVYFNDKETVLRIACRQYTENMNISKDAYLVDNNGNKYCLKHALMGNVDSNNDQEVRIFGGYFAFEPVPDDVRSLTFKDRGTTIKRIKEAKKGKIIY